MVLTSLGLSVHGTRTRTRNILLNVVNRLKLYHQNIRKREVSKIEGHFFKLLHRHNTPKLRFQLLVFFSISLFALYQEQKYEHMPLYLPLMNTEQDVLALQGCHHETYKCGQRVRTTLRFVETIQKELEYRARNDGCSIWSTSARGRISVKGVNNLARWTGYTSPQCDDALYLLWINTHWGFKLKGAGENGTVCHYLEAVRIERDTTSIGFTCRLKQALVQVCITCLVLVAGCYSATRLAKYRQEKTTVTPNGDDIIQDLAGKIVGVFEKQRILFDKREVAYSFVPLVHVRDALIPVHRKSALTREWNLAVEYVRAHEERVRFSFDDVSGEEYLVGTWESDGRSKHVTGNDVAKDCEGRGTGD